MQLTDIGDSAPRFLSRKKEAESMDVITKTIGFGLGEEDKLIGGSADQTLPFKLNIQRSKAKICLK